MTAHALLSASGAHRWLACPPSARLEQKFPDATSEYAAEGSLAHRLAEIMLRRYIRVMGVNDYESELANIQAHPLYTPEMLDRVSQYIDIAAEAISAAYSRTSDATIAVEQRVDFSEWVPGGFGTGDLVIVADGMLEIYDLKFGKGVPVQATGNPQIRLYALGAWSQFAVLYDIEYVRMTIIQPRLDSVTSVEMPIKDLLAWGDSIRPIAEMAMRGEGEFRPGEHCRFCRARATCRARAEANLELARYEFQAPETLTDDEIGEVLARAEELQRWAADVQAYALEQALAGKKFEGWKLVEGRSTRTIVDEFEAVRRLLDAGYEHDAIAPRVLLGLSKLEKLLGKKRFAELFDGLIEKPPGKPTLAPESDKRPALSPAAEAAKDFA